MVAFAGYPLMVEDRMVGVMAMFSRRPLTPEDLDTLASVADSIAQGVERKRAEESLRSSEERFRFACLRDNGMILPSALHCGTLPKNGFCCCAASTLGFVVLAAGLIGCGVGTVLLSGLNP